MPPSVIDLNKQTQTYISSLRPKWKAAKTKHAAALKAKKIDFNKNLGDKLEKRKGHYKAIKAYKTGDSLLLIKGHLDALSSNGKEIVSVAKAYQKKIVGLGGEAETELNAVLSTLIKDAGEYDIAFVKTKLKKK
jgi:hypothetical protein